MIDLYSYLKEKYIQVFKDGRKRESIPHSLNSFELFISSSSISDYLSIFCKNQHFLSCSFHIINIIHIIFIPFQTHLDHSLEPGCCLCFAEEIPPCYCRLVCHQDSWLHCSDLLA